MIQNTNIEWLKCRHGIEKRNYCHECVKEQQLVQADFTGISKPSINAPVRIPIKRGCPSTEGCFCSGRCHEIIGYRDQLFAGEKP